MKKFNEFEPIRLNNNKILIICKYYENFLLFYKKVENYLKRINFIGTVIVDQLSIYNNSSNRFYELNFNNKFDFNSAKNIDGNYELKKITSNFFYNNQKLLNNTLLYRKEIEDILNNKII